MKVFDQHAWRTCCVAAVFACLMLPSRARPQVRKLQANGRVFVVKRGQAAMEPRWSRQGAMQAYARVQPKAAALLAAMLEAPDKWVRGLHKPTGAVWVDPFRAFYPCPMQEKMGSVGDGGKWVCSKDALLSTPGCVVYSMGSNGDTSFEQAMLRDTACTVHTFDPTLNDTTAGSVRAVPGLHFQGIGLSHTDGEHVFKNQAQPVKTLQTIMTDLNHTWIDVLKVDIERHEWPVLKSWLLAYDVLPFTRCKDWNKRACVPFTSRRTTIAITAGACSTSLPSSTSMIRGTSSGVRDGCIDMPCCE